MFQWGFSSILILFILLLFGLIGTGFFLLLKNNTLAFLNFTQQRKITQQAPKTQTPKPENTPIPTPKESFKVAKPGYKEFDAPCMNFEFPQTWEITKVDAISTHKSTSNGLDTYGATSVVFQRKDNIGERVNIYTIKLNCEPLLKNSAEFSMSYAPVQVHKVFHKENEAWLVIHNPTPKDSINPATPGIKSLQGHKGFTNYLIQIEWESSVGPDPETSPMQEYSDLLESFIIRDYFKTFVEQK